MISRRSALSVIAALPVLALCKEAQAEVPRNPPRGRVVLDVPVSPDWSASPPTARRFANYRFPGVARAGHAAVLRAERELAMERPYGGPEGLVVSHSLENDGIIVEFFEADGSLWGHMPHRFQVSSHSVIERRWFNVFETAAQMMLTNLSMRNMDSSVGFPEPGWTEEELAAYRQARFEASCRHASRLASMRVDIRCSLDPSSETSAVLGRRG